MKTKDNEEIDKPLEAVPMGYIVGITVGLLIVSLVLTFFNIFYLISENPTYEKFADLHNLGDAVGGLTAPLINSIAAFLVYISFREQNRANKIQAQELNKQEKELEKERRKNEDKATYDRLNELIKESGIQLMKYQIITNIGTDSKGDAALRDFYNTIRDNFSFSAFSNIKYLLNNTRDIYISLSYILLVLDTLPIDLPERRILFIKFNNMTKEYIVHLNKIAELLPHRKDKIFEDKLSELQSASKDYLFNYKMVIK